MLGLVGEAFLFLLLLQLFLLLLLLLLALALPRLFLLSDGVFVLFGLVLGMGAVVAVFEELFGDELDLGEGLCEHL